MSKENPTFPEKMAEQGKTVRRMKFVVLSSGQKIMAHHKDVCAAQASCCIHKPSDHHMKNWKMYWRDDTKVMERICEHGIGHPDPDHLSHQRQFLRIDEQEWDSIHGCDSCCRGEGKKTPDA